jgi:hypothetical protein
MAGKMVPLWQQYSTCLRLLFNWFHGKSRITGLALQLWTLLRFILLDYIITAAGPLTHTSTSASVVWAPCMTFLSSRCALYYLQKINQSLHQCMCYHTSLCVSSLFSYLRQDNKKVMNQWCMSPCSNYCCTTFPCSSRLNP